MLYEYFCDRCKVRWFDPLNRDLVICPVCNCSRHIRLLSGGS